MLVLVFSNQIAHEKFARAIVEATTHFDDYKLIAEVSKNLGAPMKGIEISKLAPSERMQDRGW
ncbi:pyridoxal biosynthesis lyase PdxS [Paenibacillus sp. SORGH_AS338]|nr:pyridoxal biosynthesis lyase PdxS [Paenibacillus sp. SORGH_AS_0338]